MLAYLLKSSAFSCFQVVLEPGSSGEQTCTPTQLDRSSSTEVARVTLLQQHQPQRDLAVPQDSKQRYVTPALSSAFPIQSLPHTGFFPPST